MSRGYAAIGLVGIKSKPNMGGVLRAAHCFGAGLVAIQNNRLGACLTNVTKAERHIPTILTDNVLEALPYNCQTVVIELVEGARSLVDFIHPERAMYIFGPEDGSVPKRIVDKAQHVIQIPTEYCLNLAATVNVVLYDRMAKGAVGRSYAKVARDEDDEQAAYAARHLELVA